MGGRKGGKRPAGSRTAGTGVGDTVPHLMLTWQTAAGGAAFLVLAGVLTLRFAHAPRLRTIAPFVREAGVMLGLYALWQFAGGWSLGHTDRALARGYWVWSTERNWHLPSEAVLQHNVLHDSVLLQACNIYYATMHFGMLIAMLLWLYGRHRSSYGRIRTTIVLTTSACLLVALIPVAPPRLLSVGMVDTAEAYKESVYSVGSVIGADQYSAMPSVHVAWAAIVPLAVITVSRSKWRWLALLHFFITVYVVIVTANHFWADGIVAVLLLGFCYAMQVATRWLLAWGSLQNLYRTTAAGPIDTSTDDIGVR